MGSNDEMSENEEEILVYVEFEGLVDGNVFNEKQIQLDMIGIDTDFPIMQINGRFYEGTYEDVGGTYMFFTKNNNVALDDPVFDIASNLKYFAKTRKCLKMRRIFIKPRVEVLGDSEYDECIPNLNTVKQAGIPFRYQEDALSFWTTMRNNRLNALHTYLEKQRIRQQKKSQGIMLESESDEDNPFAIYNHKEEINNLNKYGDIYVNSGKESNYCNNQSYSDYIYSNESGNRTQDIYNDNCHNNFESKTSVVVEPSVLKDDSCDLFTSTKTHKTKVISKTNLNMVGNNQNKSKLSSLDTNNWNSDKEEVEVKKEFKL